MKLQLARPDITQSEIDAVVSTLKSGILSIGPKIQEFEEIIAEYIGVKHAVAVNSGTSGLHLLIKANGIKGGDEVITTPFSFAASANCVLYEGAKPVFADIDPKTMNMDIGGIEGRITARTRAIMAVDIFGQPMDMKRLKMITDKHGLVLIEDSCEAIGSEYAGIKAGSAADGAVFAFYPNKQITTGEGGVIVTNSDIAAGLCRSWRNQGRQEAGLWLYHQRLGYNYRMSELHAALGIAQMKRIEEILEKRNKVAEIYSSKLKDVYGIKIPYIDRRVTKMSWFVYTIRLDKKINRDRVIQFLSDNGIGCRPYFAPIHLQPYFVDIFGYKEGDFPETEKASKSIIALPFFNDLKEEQIDYVVEVLKEGITKA
jgi:perosamine synthetase